MIDMTDWTARDNPGATPFPILWQRAHRLKARSWRERIANVLGLLVENFL